MPTSSVQNNAPARNSRTSIAFTSTRPCRTIAAEGRSPTRVGRTNPAQCQTPRTHSSPPAPSAAAMPPAEAALPAPSLDSSDALRFARLSRLAWAILYQRVFDIDPLRRPSRPCRATRWRSKLNFVVAGTAILGTGRETIRTDAGDVLCWPPAIQAHQARLAVPNQRGLGAGSCARCCSASSSTGARDHSR
jgi:hypothetical protein